MRRFLCCFVVGVILTSSVTGQAAPDPARCAAAAAAVHDARLPAVDDTTATGFYWYRLVQCGSVGIVAAANAIRSPVFLSETEPARVRVFFNLFYATRAAALFSALRDAVQEGEASQVVQREAIRALGAMYTPLYDFYPEDFTVRPFPPFCTAYPATIKPAGNARALPADYVKQIIEAMMAAEHREDNAPDVRGAAHCWRITLERRTAPDPRKVTLKHVCDQSFVAVNKNVSDVQVTVEVEGTTDPSGRFGFWVSPKSEFPFTILVSGDAQHFVRLLVNGVQVGRKETNTEKCKSEHRHEGEFPSVGRKVLPLVP